jgi:hypothetical protein
VIYRKLQYAPKSPFHDIHGTVARLRAAYPGISDKGVNQAVKRMLMGYKPRHDGMIVHLYGEDIMTTNLPAIPAWQWIGDGERIRLLDHPIDTGACIPPEATGQMRRMLQEELAGRLNRRDINRSVLISPPGLKQTYVWRLSNGWTQEVRDDDYRLILSTVEDRQRFRDPDIHGPYTPVRSYDVEPEAMREVGRATTQPEVNYLVRQTQHRPQWQGAEVSDD